MLGNGVVLRHVRIVSGFTLSNLIGFRSRIRQTSRPGNGAGLKPGSRVGFRGPWRSMPGNGVVLRRLRVVSGFTPSLIGPRSQYCSLKDPDPLHKIDPASRLAFSRSQWVVAHLAFHAARIDPISAGNHAFLENLVQNRFMQGFLVLRGE